MTAATFDLATYRARIAVPRCARPHARIERRTANSSSASFSWASRPRDPPRRGSSMETISESLGPKGGRLFPRCERFKPQKPHSSGFRRSTVKWWEKVAVPLKFSLWAHALSRKGRLCSSMHARSIAHTPLAVIPPRNGSARWVKDDSLWTWLDIDSLRLLSQP